MAKDRIQVLGEWVAEALSRLLKKNINTRDLDIRILAGDASFRRYFRVTLDLGNGVPQKNYVLVDAPPPESLEPFVSIALAYAEANVRVPQVLASDAELGVMLLEDFGDELFYQRATTADEPKQYYQQAIDELPAIMRVLEHRNGALPMYDEALLRRENALFSDWLVGTHLQLNLSSAEQKLWQQFSDRLVDNALQQPQVGVHRDYHSRNLMLLSEPETKLGVIDFQDAVRGPITYDLVSLLRDCYVVWPDEMVQELSLHGYKTLQAADILPANVTESEWQHWFDWMGLQRHTKASGIFARLYHRDGKSGYLNDIPATVNYIQRVASKYPELAEYNDWLQQRVIPALAAKAENSLTGLERNS